MRALCKGSLLIVLALTACDAATSDEAQERAIRQQLQAFLPKAVEEFTKGGVKSREYWEGDWATREIMAMIDGEDRRHDAFYEGLHYEKQSPWVLRPPTPNSYWLPLPSEGTWTFEIGEVTKEGSDRASLKVVFTMEYSGKTSPTKPVVTYRMRREDGAWRIDDVLNDDHGEYSLRGFLTRPVYMADWPEDE